MIEQAWASLVSGSTTPATPPDLHGASGDLVSRFAVSETATACVATALMAASALQQQRGGGRAVARLARGHVAAAVRSERHFRRDAQSVGASFAPLSRFWRANDGWVRTHANYPWHRAALLTALGASDSADSLGAAIAERTAADVEEQVFAGGGVAAAVRSTERWHDQPQGRALMGEPLIGHRLAGPAPARGRPASGLPAAGVRVLDLTRVIAGPVCTRYLAALGADVLRIDPPDLPDVPLGAAADSLLGKRSAIVDARGDAGSTTLSALLRQADVVVCGYRPGALERFGLGENDLAERTPGIVVAYLDAWGHTGPWAERRGFDSVVQAASGIAMGESEDGATPGVLPCQLLDHGTGYLAAAAVLDGLRRQTGEGGTHVRRLSLARTAAWLTSTAIDALHPSGGTAEDARWLGEAQHPDARLTFVQPPGELGGRPLQWPLTSSRYGTDPPQWATSLGE